MAEKVIMPRQGQSVETCLILAWKKKVGEKVSEGEVLCEVETDKAAFEVEAPVSGTVLKIFFQEGEDVAVLALIALIGEPGEKLAEAPEAPTPPGHSLEGVSEAAGPAGPSKADKTGPQRISPRARNLAKEKGLDITGLAGTGPGGRILERDVRLALAGGRGPAAVGGPSLVGVTEIPVKGIRKLIAERMSASLQNTAQLTMSAQAEAERLLAFRERLSSVDKLSINDLVLYAVARTLPGFKHLNAHFLGDKILVFDQIHLGFAVETPRGLMVPVIRNAHTLTLREIGAEKRRLAEACLKGKISPDELTGGTFTVTNLGVFNIESFTPLLNPPQVAVLGVCSVQPRPVLSPVGGKVRFVPHLGLSLTIDHQAVDGTPAARFLNQLARSIANFDLLLV